MGKKKTTTKKVTRKKVTTSEANEAVRATKERVNKVFPMEIPEDADKAVREHIETANQGETREC